MPNVVVGRVGFHSIAKHLPCVDNIILNPPVPQTKRHPTWSVLRVSPNLSLIKALGAIDKTLSFFQNAPGLEQIGAFPGRTDATSKSLSCFSNVPFREIKLCQAEPGAAIRRVDVDASAIEPAGLCTGIATTRGYAGVVIEQVELD